MVDGDLYSEFSAQNRQYYRSKVWPMAIVIYKVNARLRQSADFAIVFRAMRTIEKSTCVMFQEAEMDDELEPKNVIMFEEEGADWPSLGFQEGFQVLKLSSIARCGDPGHSSHALMMMMRILGLPMMSNRYDRDNYICIHWNNVQKGEELYLEKAPEAAWLKHIPYDFGSVSHAPANFLCPGCLTTYTVEPIQDHLWHRTLEMGRHTQLSAADIRLINTVYSEQCQSGAVPVPPSDVEDDEDLVKPSFHGTTELPNVPKDNSHYVEGVSRYIWMPDGDNQLHLVDLKAPIPAAADIEKGSSNAYWLFTRNNPTEKEIIVDGMADMITDSNYDASKPLSVIVHGWWSDGNSEINPTLTEAFLEAQDTNVIVVDWSKIANKDYEIAVACVRRVGNSLGDFLTWLVNTTGGDWSKVHLVGFSLGAHVVGYAGRRTGGKPARVTGLDPAGPCWEGKPDALNKSAGQYVEAIHTDSGVFGMLRNNAHSDFYPNGGRIQPGCWTHVHSHSRAYDLFAATVRMNHLVGHRCNDLYEAWEVQCHGTTLSMGGASLTKRGNGIYGLATGEEYPFLNINTD